MNLYLLTRGKRMISKQMWNFTQHWKWEHRSLWGSRKWPRYETFSRATASIFHLAELPQKSFADSFHFYTCTVEKRTAFKRTNTEHRKRSLFHTSAECARSNICLCNCEKQKFGGQIPGSRISCLMRTQAEPKVILKTDWLGSFSLFYLQESCCDSSLKPHQCIFVSNSHCVCIFSFCLFGERVLSPGSIFQGFLIWKVSLLFPEVILSLDEI